MDRNVQPTTGTPLPLILASFVIVVAGMKAANAILVPFFLAVFIAVICTPPLLWMQTKGVPKILALLLILAIILAVGLFFGVLIGSSLNQFMHSFPDYQERLSGGIVDTIGWLHDKGIHIPEEELSGVFNPGWVINLAGDILSTVTGIFTNTFLILVTAMLILLEVTDLPKKLRVVLTEPERSLSTIERFSYNAKIYLVTKTLIGVATGLTVWLWLLLLGVDYALLWGTLAFLLNYVPNVGSIIAALPPILLALITLGLGSGLLTLFGLVVINVVFGVILEPKVMGTQLKLSTLVVFLSLVFWGWVLGPLGMVLSVPMTNLIVIAMKSYEKTRKLAIMLGSATEEEWIEQLKATE
jgi:AI-2 transport protein TqsA